VLPHCPLLQLLAHSTAVQFPPSLSDASKPATNLNDMPDGGVLAAAVSRGSVLFGQQARQFQQANWPRRRTGRYSTRLQLTRPGKVALRLGDVLRECAHVGQVQFR